MELIFKVYRHDPTAGTKPALESYPVSLPDGATVLDGLLQIRDRHDGGLAFRAACGRGFCGECTLRINRSGKLACITRVAQVAKDGEVTVEPVRNITVLKDLVYDVDELLWQKIAWVEPWLRPATAQPDGGYVIPDAELEPIRKAMSCYYCGLCDEGCSVIPFDRRFSGPAALTKAFRVVFDPRDGAARERLKRLGEPRGMWDCVHCYEANEHCPRGIDPTDRIFDLRDKAVELGVKSGTANPQVARHYDSFAASVRQSGWLDEGRLALETWGLGRLGELLPMAWRALRRGKLPVPYLHRKRPGAEWIRRIFDKVEKRS
ncbi:MAG: hypothetical protein HYV61_06285 [Candidatus Rokubacteria bacterium]|nr:hypothetical protein [Candidatus Rokubacteria bacterium]